MALVTAAQKTAAVAVAQKADGQYLLLADISWETYIKLGEALANRNIRMTFSKGVLEIMTLSFEHERLKYYLSRLVDALTEELELPVQGGGSTTFQKEDLVRGLEPDSCWWIAHEQEIRGKEEINLDLDPPPDLAVEIDVTHSSLDRMGIYGALRVPEIWRYDGTKLTFHLLRKGKKKYTESATSKCFPRLISLDVQAFLELCGSKDINALVRQFRLWIRKHLAGNK